MADNETNEQQAESSAPETPETPAPAPEAAPESEAAPQAEAPETASPEAAAPESAPAAPQQGAPGGGRGHGGGRGEGGGRGQQRGGGRRRDAEREAPSDGIEETVVRIYRCATVVKGGRRFSFAALVVAGDRNGRVGVGYGKANEVPNAVEKGTKAARRNMIKIELDGGTVPHMVTSKYRASVVRLIPANEGTGVIAGDSVRAVMELAGVKDVLTKVYGSTGPKNLVKAAVRGLQMMRSKDQVGKLRGVKIA